MLAQPNTNLDYSAYTARILGQNIPRTALTMASSIARRL